MTCAMFLKRSVVFVGFLMVLGALATSISPKMIWKRSAISDFSPESLPPTYRSLVIVPTYGSS